MGRCGRIIGPGKVNIEMGGDLKEIPQLRTKKSGAETVNTGAALAERKNLEVMK